MTESSCLSALEMALNAILAAVSTCYGNTHLYRSALVTHLLIQLFLKAVQVCGYCAGVWVSLCSSALFCSCVVAEYPGSSCAEECWRFYK